MNWDAIGAVGAVIGAAAVVISIVYLSVQIRQNTKSAKLSVEQNIASSMTSFLFDQAHTDIPDIYVRGSQNFSGLTDEEAAKFGFFVLGMFRVFQQAHDQRCEGNLSDRSWESIENAFISQIRAPGVKAAWKIRGDTFKLEFREYIDSLEIDESILPPQEAVAAIRAVTEEGGVKQPPNKAIESDADSSNGLVDTLN